MANKNHYIITQVRNEINIRGDSSKEISLKYGCSIINFIINNITSFLHAFIKRNLTAFWYHCPTLVWISNY